MAGIIRTDCLVEYTTPSLSKNFLNVNCAADDSDIWHWKYFWSKTTGTPTVVQTQDNVRSIIPAVVIAGEDTATTGGNFQVVLRTFFAYIADQPVPIKVNMDMSATCTPVGASGISEMTNFEIYTKIFKPNGELFSTVYSENVSIYSPYLTGTYTNSRNFVGFLPATNSPLICFSWMRSVGYVKDQIASKKVYCTYDIEFSDVVVNTTIIQVSAGAGSIANDSNLSFTATDISDFSSSSLYFEISNKGSSTLYLYGSPSLSGPNAADFSVSQVPSLTVEPGKSTSMFVSFKPHNSGGTAGKRSAKLSIASNASNHNPFVLNIDGMAEVNPQMLILDAEEDYVYSGSGAAFGDVLLGFSRSLTLTIKNTGLSNLLLNGSPVIDISGQHASDYIIEETPAQTTITPGNTTTFRLKFTPSASGYSRNALLKIISNDPRRLSAGYGVYLSGSGYRVGQKITIEDPSGATLANNSSLGIGSAFIGEFITTNLTIRNPGTSQLDITSASAISDFTITFPPNTVGGTSSLLSVPAGGTSTMTIKFAPKSVGYKSGLMTLSTTDPDNRSYKLTLNGLVLSSTAEIAVEQAGINIVRGGSVAFDNVNIGSEKILTFTVRNHGNSVLTLGNVSVGGTHPSSFSVTTQPSTEVAPNKSTTFAVKFSPTGSVGTHSALISFTNNDSDESPFAINLSGSATASTSEISIDQAGLDIATEGSISFGTVSVGFDNSLTFVVRNTGTAVLNLGQLAISGLNQAQFSITSSPNSTVAVGASTAFTVKFAPTGTASGARSAKVSINNNDSNENPFVINFTGTAVVPDISVEQNGLIVPRNSTFNLGTYELGLTEISRTFTISNTGTGVLKLTGTSPTGYASSTKLIFSGNDLANFSIADSAQPTTIVPAGGTTNFTVSFSASSVGSTYQAALSIESNDPDETPYIVNFTAVCAQTVEIAVLDQNGNDLVSNGTAVAFGSAVVGSATSAATLIFTIRSVGAGQLNLQPNTSIPRVSTSGGNAGDFAITQQPTQYVNGGTSTTFTAKFTPSASGVRTTSLRIQNNDTDENPFIINVTGTGVADAPEMAVTQGGANIATNGTKDFGTAAIGSTSILTFTISNTAAAGSSSLSLTGNPSRVAISGTHATQFAVTTQPSALVTAGSSTAFIVVFTPSGTAGARTAKLSIANNDSDENPFVINVTGTASIMSAQMTIQEPIGSDITDNGSRNLGTVILGSNTVRTFTVRNTAASGSAALLLNGSPLATFTGPNASDFSLTTNPTSSISPGGSTTFNLRFAPSALGYRTAKLTIQNNDPNNNPYDINLSGTAIAPPSIRLYEVSSGNTLLNNGITRSFGNVAMGADSTIEFKIVNAASVGSANLELTGNPTVSITGVNAADFVVQTTPSTPVAAQYSTNFSVKFTPSGISSRNATLTITHNEPGNGTYTLLLTGSGYNPTADISVEQSGIRIANNGLKDFGTTTISSRSDLIFVIRNSGTGYLNLNGAPRVAISGANSSDFSVVTAPYTPVDAYGTSSFIVRFTPSAVGSRFAQLSIASNDADSNPYLINISGTGEALPPEISISQSDTNINTTGFCNFGKVTFGLENSLSIKIVNSAASGSSNLELTGTPNLISISGTNPSDFSITTEPSSIVPAQSSTNFTVKFKPLTFGNRKAVLSIDNNDSNESPFIINVSGDCVQPPEIAVEQPSGSNIDRGGSRSFGNVVTGTTKNLSFYIRNASPAGSADLKLTGNPDKVSVSGDNAGDFSVGNVGESVSAAGSLGFIVSFAPSALGLRSATLSIPNNDSDENPFTVNISGTGVLHPPEISIEQSGTEILHNGSKNFGPTAYGREKILTFTILNKAPVGGLPLNLTNTPMLFFGAGSSPAFSISTPPPVSSIAAGDNTTFMVKFDPGYNGTDYPNKSYTAVLVIINDDPNGDESAYKINLSGVGYKEVPAFVVKKSGTEFDNNFEYSFGDVTPGGSVSLTFEVHNDTDNPLADYLLISPTTGIIGSNPSDFSIVEDATVTGADLNFVRFLKLLPSYPSQYITPSSYRTFKVLFKPTTAVGTRKAQIKFYHNGITSTSVGTFIPASPFVLNFTGTVGGVAQSFPEISIDQASNNIINGGSVNFDSLHVGSTKNLTFNIKNIALSGSDSLQLTGGIRTQISGTHSDEFKVVDSGPYTQLPIAPGASWPFSIKFAPIALGMRSAQVTIANNDPDEDPFVINISGTGISPPEISVEQSGVNIVSGGSKDFGTVYYSREKSLTFTIRNVGLGALKLTGSPLVNRVNLPLSTNVGQTFFSVITQPSVTEIPPGGSTTFVVKLAPILVGDDNYVSYALSYAGTISAQFSIASDDQNENPFLINCTAFVSLAPPDIAIEQPAGNEIVNGGEVNFGTKTINVGDSLNFRILNKGPVDGNWLAFRRLNILGLTASTLPEFTITKDVYPKNSLHPLESADFTIKFTPRAAGVRAAQLLIESNDPDESPTVINLKGYGEGPPMISIQTLVTNFGSVTLGSSKDMIISVLNSGSEDLVLGTVTVSGTDASQFTILTQPTSPVPMNSRTSFTVRFRPVGTTTGYRNATLTFSTNDPNKPTQIIPVSGYANL